MKRGFDDKKWQEVKKQVHKRDRDHCRFIRTLSLKEVLLLQKYAQELHQKNLLSVIDPAHVFPVSVFPHLCYEILNVIQISRFVHEQLENHHNPLDGECLTETEYNTLYIKILGMNTFSTLAMWATNPENYKKEKEKKDE